MKGFLATLFLSAGTLLAQQANPFAAPPQAPKEGKMTQVVIETSKGNITAELDTEHAPGTVSNFLAYVDQKFYDGTIFHRVIDGFMIQGGGFTTNMMQKAAGKPIKNEAAGSLSNKRGTLAMARTAVVDSATCQFFINLVDNGFLDFKNKTDQGYGYCVFGRVTEGMDIVDAIAKVQTGFSGRYENVPNEPVLIKSIKRK